MNTAKYELPESLKLQLRAFEQKLRRTESVIAICGAGAGFLIAWLLLYVSDRIWETPFGIRLAVAVGAMIACGVCARYWLRHWIYRRRSAHELAKLIQKEHRTLGDRLLGVVELADGDHPENLSPGLVRAAIRQVAQQSEGMDFQEAVDSDRPRSFGVVFGLVLLVFAALLAFNPAAGLNTLHRLVNPDPKLDRYTFVKLSDIPKELVVPHGETFTLKVGVAKDSFKKPGFATARVGDLRDVLRPPIRNDYAVFTVPGQTEQTTLRLRVWDAVRTITIVPMYRPVIKELQAFVTYPDYLQKSSKKQKVEGGVISILQGSRVAFRASMQDERKLAAAHMLVDEIEGQAPELLESGFLTSELPAESGQSLRFTWEDVNHLSASRPYKIRIRTLVDTAPVVSFPKQPRYEAMLVDESKEIEIVAQDDQGLKHLSIEWYVDDSDGNRLNRGIVQQQIAAGGPDKARLAEKFIFAPSLMRIPPQSVVTLQATTADFFPKRGDARSPEHRIYILSREEHAKLIKDRFEQIQARLEDLTRSELDLKRRTDEMAKMSDKELKRKEITDRIAEMKAEETANKREMERLAKQGMDLLKEALRNKNISAEQLREWAKMLETMNKIAKQNMRQAQKSLGKAQKGGKSRKGDLKEAAEEMAKTLQKMQKLLKDFNQSMENLAAKNFVRRLESLSRDEKQVRTDMQGMLKETIGMDPEALPKDVARRLRKITRRCRVIRRESETLMDDLEQFFIRTRLQKFDKVVQDMKGKNLLDRLSDQVKTAELNHGISLIQTADKWAAEFKKWADALRSKNNSRGEGNGQGKQLTPEQMEALLKLMRIIQEEYNILSQTRRLDRHKDFDEEYGTKSKELGKKQGDVRKILDEVIAKVPPQGQGKLKQAGKAMNDARDLLEIPETGGQTRAAEMEVIELLTNGMNDASKSMGAGSGAITSLMLQLLQQMGMGGSGTQGGGSMKGGGIDSGKTKVDGKASQDSLSERATDRATGKSLDQVPPEFREALKSYFNKVEQLEK